ncbi:MAG TPA: bifunctional serine/threonine-protein kinase/universal stress protein [Caldimonas sp.]|nr:bifunctional serine/threonine-protein kinase/universal stress protein [Caldimonas sp.]
MTPEASVAPASLEVGQVVDGYRLDALAHRGGMATLWHVSRVDADGSAAALPLLMKVPRLRGGDDPTAIVGFEVEQMIMPTLTGPHVPRYVAHGDITRLPYIVMERIEGRSLRERFDAAPLPIDEVALLGAKVATALHDLHRQRVVHLDVKPSNVMLRRQADGSDGDAVLIDFGLSRHDLLPDLLEEEFELPMGTSPYMSPEQVRFVRNDPRSDLFSTGVMLYHLTTGERPFGAPGSVHGLRRRLYREPTAPRSLRADCPPWLQEVILRCLEVRPERRYQTAAQLAFDLQHPDQVALGERADRTGSGSALGVVKRWFVSLRESDAIEGGAGGHSARSPIVLAAIDIDGADPALLEAARDTALRLLETESGARLACLTVMRINRVGMDDLLDGDGTPRHLKLLIALRHWARPLQQALGAAGGTDRDAAARVTFHVIEAVDPAAAIVDYARRNQIDHIVMGARSSGRLRRHLGSVSARVVAESDCTVTVVRAPASAS